MDVRKISEKSRIASVFFNTASSTPLKNRKWLIGWETENREKEGEEEEKQPNSERVIDSKRMKMAKRAREKDRIIILNDESKVKLKYEVLV